MRGPGVGLAFERRACSPGALRRGLPGTFSRLAREGAIAGALALGESGSVVIIGLGQDPWGSSFAVKYSLEPLVKIKGSWCVGS